MDMVFHLTGLDKASEITKSLPHKLRAKGARVAGRKAANVIRDAARANALRLDRAETPLKIADNVNVQFASRTLKRTGDVMFRIGVRGGAKAYGNTKQNRALKRVGAHYATGGSTYYWRFLEFGTSKMRARPFLRPAGEQNIEKATNVFVREIDRQMAKLAKKGP